jgi:hypothetical protein
LDLTNTDISFRLAPMSAAIRVLTAVLLTIPAGLLAAAGVGYRPLAYPALMMIAIYCWVWLRFRPTHFRVRPEGVEVVWPLKRRLIPRRDISSVQLIDLRGLKREIGWGVRVGAGGLWGGFGWLWTTRCGVVQMYISRADGMVWIERAGDRPWLITPEQPELFVQASIATGIA